VEGDGLCRWVDFGDFTDVGNFGAGELQEPAWRALFTGDETFGAELGVLAGETGGDGSGGDEQCRKLDRQSGRGCRRL